MDIEQLKDERTKLAASISRLIASFEERTQVMVKDVDLTIFMNDADAMPVRTDVSVRLELP